jgi:hypothetical protein
MEGPGENGPAIPRDMPDQEVQPGPDPLDIGPGARDDGDHEGSHQQIPDADESGAARRGGPYRSVVKPEHPAPGGSSG